MGHVVSFFDDRHYEAELLLPWYVTGQPDLADCALVEAHLADCAACRADVAAERTLAAAISQQLSDSEAGWEALQQKLSATIPSATLAAAPMAAGVAPLPFLSQRGARARWSALARSAVRR